MSAPAMQTKPTRIPTDEAFGDCAFHVRSQLDRHGIRWSDQAEQAAVCTMLIAASQKGWLLPWNDPPAVPAAPRTPTPINRPAPAAEPARPAIFPPAPPLTGGNPPQPLKTAPSAKSFPVMIGAFREIEGELP